MCFMSFLQFLHILVSSQGNSSKKDWLAMLILGYFLHVYN